MKKIIVLLMANLFVCGLLFVQSCGKKDPSPTEQASAILTSGFWKMKTVLVDGVDQTNIYKGLTITFTSSAYTTTNGGQVWPASGTWIFSDNTGKAIIRSDGLPISIPSSTDNNTLILKLSWAKTTFGPGRASSLKGENVFTFGK